MGTSQRRSFARTFVAFVVVAAAFGPLRATEAKAAGQPCRAQRIGAMPAWKVAACRPPTIPPPSKANYVEIDLLTRVNQERQARGVAPLVSDPRLVQFARDWSFTMASSGFRHSDIRRLFEGRFNFVGENIAWASGSGATAGNIHVMWMQSTGHRKNMLSPGFDSIGIGVFCGPDGKLWATQNFGHRTVAGPAPPSGNPSANPMVRGDPGSFTCS